LKREAEDNLSAQRNICIYTEKSGFKKYEPIGGPPPPPFESATAVYRMTSQQLESND